MEVIEGKKKSPTRADLMIKRLEVKKRLGGHFREIRECTTYEEIERALGISTGLYQAWEQGFQFPDIKVAQKVSEYFGYQAMFKLLLLINEIQTEAQLYHREINTPITS